MVYRFTPPEIMMPPGLRWQPTRPEQFAGRGRLCTTSSSSAPQISTTCCPSPSQRDVPRAPPRIRNQHTTNADPSTNDDTLAIACHTRVPLPFLWPHRSLRCEPHLHTSNVRSLSGDTENNAAWLCWPCHRSKWKYNVPSAFTTGRTNGIPARAECSSQSSSAATTWVIAT